MSDPVPEVDTTEKPVEDDAPDTPTTPDTEETNENPEPSVRLVLQQIDGIRDHLKEVVRDLTQTIKLLKHVEREKKANEKEVAQIRAKLREIQSFEI